MLHQHKKYALPVTTVLYVREDPAATDPAATAQAATQKLIEDSVAAAVLGLKNKNEELLGKLKTQNEQLKSYAGIDPEKAKAWAANLDNDEDAKLFAEGKKHVVIDKHTQRMRDAHAEEIKGLQDLVKAEAQRADAWKGSVLDSKILTVTNVLHKSAVDDALLLARTVFSLDAKGNAIKLDSEGKPELGKDGKTPFSPSEWIELQRNLKPHWFPAASSGGGSGGSVGAAGTGKVIKRASFDSMAPSEQGSYVKGGGKIID